MKLFKKFSLLSIILLTNIILNAQPDLLWRTELSLGTGFYHHINTSDGGFLAVGQKYIGPYSIIYENTDAYIVKFDENGNVLWQKSYGGEHTDLLKNVIELPDGGYLAVGTSMSDSGIVNGYRFSEFSAWGQTYRTPDIWVLRLDDTGALLWNKCYGGLGTEDIVNYNNASAENIQFTADGGFVIVGNTNSEDTINDVNGYHGDIPDWGVPGYGDIWMFKIDSAGILQWQKCIGGSNNEVALSVIKAVDGGYMIGAHTNSSDGDASGSGWHGSNDYWAVKTDSLGNIEWQKCYGGSGTDEITAIIASQEGGYLIAGTSNSKDGDVAFPISGTASNKPWFVKIDDKGSIVWEHTHNIPPVPAGNWERLHSIVQNINGTYTFSHFPTTRYNRLITINSTGDSVIHTIDVSYNNNSDSIPGHLIQLRDGSYVVSKPTTGLTSTEKAILMKFSACPSYTYEEATICKGSSYTLGSQTITAAGIYWDTLTMASGCDSLIQLTVTMDSVIQPNITNNKGVLSTNNDYATYQWLKDGSPVSTGGTSYTYTAFEAGNYQVVVSNTNGCTDTSEAYPYAPSSIHEPSLFSNMKLYPNPASQVVNIEIPQLQGKAIVELTSLDGRIITTQQLSIFNFQLSIKDLPDGVYFIKVSTEAGIVVRKIVKE